MADNLVLKRWEENAKSWTVLVRAEYDVYRDVLNTPAFLIFLPAIVGLKGLDIGYGEAGNTKVLARKGATMFGIDFAPTFIRHAREAEQHTPLNIEFHLADCKELPFAQASFDFAVAFMSLMDVDDLDWVLDRALDEAYRVLKPGGVLQFSILHPCFTAIGSQKVCDENGDLIGRSSGKYFTSCAGEEQSWTFGAAPDDIKARHAKFIIPRFHLPISNWVNSVIAAGFELKALQEPRPTAAEAEVCSDLADNRIVPLFLHVRARKSGGRPPTTG